MDRIVMNKETESREIGAGALKRRDLMVGTMVAASALAAAGSANAQAGGQPSSPPTAAASAPLPPLPAGGNTILVTGGATGLGRALAAHFHSLGNTVIIASRRTALLESVAAEYPGMQAMTVDIRDPYSVRRLAQDIRERYPTLNVLINDAGIMRRENMFNAVDYMADSQDQVETNLNGTIRVTTELLPLLQGQARARIVNISSGLGFVPRAAFSTYSATKAATHAYTMSLRYQLRKTSIDVVEIAPPALRTEIVPGQSKIEALLPVDDFIAQAMPLYHQVPAPHEVIVPRAAVTRRAEAEGRVDQTFAALNSLDG
jgi:uncharacterized oxidoreductase